MRLTEIMCHHSYNCTQALDQACDHNWPCVVARWGHAEEGTNKNV